MDDPQFWLGILFTLLDSVDPRTITLSFPARYLVSLAFRYIIGLLVEFKFTRRSRRNGDKVIPVNVLTVILLGRFAFEFIVWMK